MRSLRLILIGLFLILIIAGAGYFGFVYLKPKNAGISIETNPVSIVFIDGQQVGRTTYKATRKPGEIVVKLVPESVDRALAPFETKASLSSGIETVIKRDFGETEEDSAGEIISFEKIGGDEATLSVVSIPDAAQISIDGQIRGFSPYKSSTLTPDEHQVVVSAPGYLERSLSVNTAVGYRLIAVVKLAPSGEVAAEEEEIEVEERFEVEIGETPNNFLRVRSEPNTQGEELARVNSGERFPFISQDEESSWFKIEYEPAREGWVSNEYAKKIEEGSPSSEPEATP